MGLINNTVYLENNYSLWKEMFNKEKEVLEKLIPNSVIEHVGSTSIPNLLAKPIIDIVVGLNNLNIDDIQDKLKELYEIKYNTDEILLIKENNNETNYLIHILDINSDRYKNMIKFRDLLINNEKIRKEYEKLKIELKNKYCNNREMYTKSKSVFIMRCLDENNNI
jgi:GrpB-like predicted nucleotidyltransferase (UPF0157 family)